jgi:hypothetical protein
MKNLSTALEKFNKMYEFATNKHIITEKDCDTVRVVINYGKNLVKMYSSSDCINEVDESLRVLVHLMSLMNNIYLCRR